ncbi:MAG: MBL fold metallo-hydrolase [Ruminococcaceae bacterium]|nr:MBL fold metallo-hydrolase [Oscillospiraceae bacterium]
MNLTRLVLGNLMTNCYILKNKEQKLAAVIDPAADAPRILAELEGYQAAFILLTHGHFDHILALDELREATGMPVYVHRDDADFLTDARKNYSLPATGKNRTFRPAEHLLEGGERIAFGNEILRVLHTPGHTMGSVCYRIGSTIFSGDTLFENDMGRTDLYGGNQALLMKSLKTLCSIPGNADIFPGHGMATTLEAERENNIFLRYLDEPYGTHFIQ